MDKGKVTVALVVGGLLFLMGIFCFESSVAWAQGTEVQNLWNNLGKTVTSEKKMKSSIKILSEVSSKWLMETDDEITIQHKKLEPLLPGTLLGVYRKRDVLLDENGNLKDEKDE